MTNLPDERREEFARLLCERRGLHQSTPVAPVDRPCRRCRDEADALAPMLARWLAEAEAKALREAADWCESIFRDAMGVVRADYADGWRAACCDAMLSETRDRADRIERDGER